MLTINVVLIVVAFICLLLAALNVPANRVHLGWLGLALWALSMVVR